MADEQRHRVVIIGGGFGGLYAARGLKRAACDVTLIDRRNFHLFQPLLYQVATGALSPANIAAPLRSLFKSQSNVATVLGDVAGFDAAAKTVTLADGAAIPFDTLVVAAGSTHHYFGKDAAWEPHAPGLKSIEDATEIRRKILTAFEQAERASDPKERAKLLTFVVVGGGPTGVELAGSVAELAHITLRRDFRNINPTTARVLLVEGQKRILPTFAEKLSAKAGRALEKMGVECWYDCHVTGVFADRVEVTTDTTKELRVAETATVLWAAGVKASPLGKMLADQIPGVEADRGGRVTVAADCTLPGRPDIFLIGDMATFKGADGKPLPGVAPVAMQQGNFVAAVIARRLKNESPPAAFKYWDKGSMATIGRAQAVAETNGLKLSGFIAWLAWLFIHILYLARFENRFLVMFQWAFNFITRNRAARLITGVEGEHLHVKQPPK